MHEWRLKGNTPGRNGTDAGAMGRNGGCKNAPVNRRGGLQDIQDRGSPASPASSKGQKMGQKCPFPSANRGFLPDFQLIGKYVREVHAIGVILQGAAGLCPQTTHKEASKRRDEQHLYAPTHPSTKMAKGAQQYGGVVSLYHCSVIPIFVFVSTLCTIE